MDEKYILEGKEPVAVDLISWASWYGKADRKVKKDKVGDVSVSTVFLGLDHQWGDGPPLLFETMVFGGELDQEMDRYSTWEEAESGHAKMVERVKDYQRPTKKARRK